MNCAQNIRYKNYIIHHFNELESTNILAYNLANDRQIFHNEIILADTQSGGRGRLNRSWISPFGNLYFSLVLQPKIDISKISQASFVAVCALQKAVETLFNKNNLSASIKNKWPNDLLINNNKVSGILLENKINNNSCEFLVIGIGVNIASNPHQTIFPATNLSEFSIHISALEMLKLFLDEFDILYDSWLKFGFKNIRNFWLKNAYNLKQNITIKPNDINISGVFKDIDDDGNILVEIDGKESKFFFGDIFVASQD